MLATAALLVFQASVRPVSAFPWASVSAAVSVTFPVTLTAPGLGVMVTVFTGAGTTVTAALLEVASGWLASAVATMDVAPGLIPATSSWPPTAPSVATVGSSVVQVTGLASVSPNSSLTTAATVACQPLP